MKYNDVKKFLELIGPDVGFGIYFTKTMSDFDDSDNMNDYFEVSDHCELLENSLLIIEETDKEKFYYLFDLDRITQLRTNY